jgi:hypothetical protein
MGQGTIEMEQHMDTQEKHVHKDGKPWKNVRTFASFEEADLHRKELLSDENKQVKIKVYKNAAHESLYIVKQRLKAEPQEENKTTPTKKEKRK